MRKLRKKIYKYTSTHRPSKKPRDSIHDILTLLKPRNLPDFLIDPLKKRRNFDLNSIKNVVVPNGATFNEMASLTMKQETEIEKIFADHRSRVSNAEKRTTLKLEKKPTTYSSSSESDDDIENSSEGSEKFKTDSYSQEIKHSEGIPSITHDSEDHHFRCEDEIFHDHGFLALERDLYSEE